MLAFWLIAAFVGTMAWMAGLLAVSLFTPGVRRDVDEALGQPKEDRCDHGVVGGRV